MPARDEDFNLEPMGFLFQREVPGAGRAELVKYKRDREDDKASLTIWAALTFFGAILTSAISTGGNPLAYAVFLILTCYGAAKTAIGFFRMHAGRGAWRVLPEGASETTALLEDKLTKSIREWNDDVGDWNDELDELNEGIEEWKRRSSAPDIREDGWSEASHAMDQETLMTRGKTLMLRRSDLAARRRRIRKAIAELDSAMRRARTESQDDPEAP